MKKKRAEGFTEKLHSFFKEVWDKREDETGSCYCYETGRELPGFIFRSNSTCYHHVLPKNKYPEFAFEEWNIVILHPKVHMQVESNLDKCPKVKELTKKLKNERC